MPENVVQIIPQGADGTRLSLYVQHPAEGRALSVSTGNHGDIRDIGGQDGVDNTTVGTIVNVQRGQTHRSGGTSPEAGNTKSQRLIQVSGWQFEAVSKLPAHRTVVQSCLLFAVSNCRLI